MIINGDYFNEFEIESFTYKSSKESTLTTKGGRQWKVPCSEKESRAISNEIKTAIMGGKE
jgi:hypothetical protein